MSRAILSRMMHAVGVARTAFVDDTGPVQRLQVIERPGADGSPSITDGVAKVGQFGFVSNPPVPSEVVLLRLAGNRTLSLVIGTNHQPSRLRNLMPGDAAMHDVRGAKVLLGPTGIIIDGAGLPMTVQNVGSLTLEGNLVVTGTITAQGEITSALGFTAGTTPLAVP